MTKRINKVQVRDYVMDSPTRSGQGRLVGV